MYEIDERNECIHLVNGNCYSLDAMEGICPYTLDSVAALRCGCYERKTISQIEAARKTRVVLIKYPSDGNWLECKERALVTVGKTVKTPPDKKWKAKILKARHSPIRCLRFSFELTIPYWVSVHLARHIHAQPYILSQRNDRQDKYDRNAARQDEMVDMIWDMNAEELITIAQKRLCNLAAKETRDVVQEMCNEVNAFCPEFREVLVPPCEFNGCCHEMSPCGKLKAEQEAKSKAADILLKYTRRLVMTHPEGKLLDEITPENSEFQKALEIVYNNLKGDSSGN